MKNWYLYYRLLRATQTVAALQARLELQDVLIDLRSKARAEWPNATAQEVQDFFEYLSGMPVLFSEKEAHHLTMMKPWAK